MAQGPRQRPGPAGGSGAGRLPHAGGRPADPVRPVRRAARPGGSARRPGCACPAGQACAGIRGWTWTTCGPWPRPSRPIPGCAPTCVTGRTQGLCEVGGRLLFPEARDHGGSRSYHLVAVDTTPYLARTLALARDGERLDVLAQALVTSDISAAEAAAYVAELVDSQLLVADSQPQVTGPPPAHGMATVLAAARGHQRHRRTSCAARWSAWPPSTPAASVPRRRPTGGSRPISAACPRRRTRSGSCRSTWSSRPRGRH